MCVRLVSVKWTKETYEVDYDPADGFDGFQALLFSLTNVPVDRQKLMAKGKMLKDASALGALKDGEKVMLMGSADAAPKAPEKAIVFEEDLSDAQKATVIKNLLQPGNTCYMASTLQCLRAIPELKQALITKSNAAAPSFHDPNFSVVKQLGALYHQMDRTTGQEKQKDRKNNRTVGTRKIGRQVCCSKPMGATY
jgi:ubiquitin carboxyl-terminal hydrolase 14